MTSRQGSLILMLSHEPAGPGRTTGSSFSVQGPSGESDTAAVTGQFCCPPTIGL